MLPKSVLVIFIKSRNLFGVNSGLPDFTKAAIPDTCGAEKDVPLT